MITVKEDLAGRVGNLTGDGNASVSRKYTVLGATTEDEAISAVRDYIVLTLGPNLYGLVLDTISADEEVWGCWRSTANWKTFARKSPPKQGESQFNFEIGLEPVRVRVPVSAIDVFKIEDAPDWQPELINDLGDGEDAEGVDVYEPTYEESETVWGPTEALTPTYRNKLKRLVGKTNSQPFKGWDIGEVLLMGVSGTRRGAEDSELTFRWSVRENQDDLTVGQITGISKQGWQYLWPRYDKVRQSNGPAVNAITHVAVATVFRQADFKDLDIGV